MMLEPVYLNRIATPRNAMKMKFISTVAHHVAARVRIFEILFIIDVSELVCQAVSAKGILFWALMENV